MTVQELYDRTFATSARLSRMQMPYVISPLDVIRILNRAKIPFVLVGAYGIAGWLDDPRATEDVDIVVPARRVKKAVTLLLEEYPDLEAIDLAAVTRLRNPVTSKVVIDVMKPVQQPYVAVFKHKHTLIAEKQKYSVPSLEMALVMKFSALTSFHRSMQDKYQDAHDFSGMVRNNPKLDQIKLAAIANLIYPDGGKDVVAMVGKARAGEKLDF